MWNFLSNQAARLIEQAEDLFNLIPASQRRTMAQGGPTASANNNAPAAVVDDFDADEIRRTINESLGLPNIPAAPIELDDINPEEEEFNLAVQASIVEHQQEAPEETSIEAFIKLREFLTLIGIDPISIDAVASRFNDYAEECYNSAGNLRDGKTLEEMTDEYLALSEIEQAKLRGAIQNGLYDANHTFVNKINGLVPLFSRSITLADITSRIPDAVPDAPRTTTTSTTTTTTTTSTSSSSQPVVPPAPVVFSPSAPAPIATPPTTSSSSTTPTLTEKQQREIQARERAIHQYARITLRKIGTDITTQVNALRHETNYANCGTFEEKMAALKAQEKLIDALAISIAASQVPAQTSTSSTDEPNAKRSRNR